MENTREHINKYLIENEWKGLLLEPFNHYELKMWNSFDSDVEGFEWYHKRMDSLARSVAGEWQARHSAMTPEGASAYADNWN